MKNITDSCLLLGTSGSPGSFGFNTDILATNPINISVVLGVLIFFGKGVLNDLLDNRKQRILSAIRNSEELCVGAIEQLERARTHLHKVEIEADEYQVNGYSQIEQEKKNGINAAFDSLERLENYKTETLIFEQQIAINKVNQRVFLQALGGALRTLNSCLNSELHARTISANIGILVTVGEKVD
uniref:ATP synthase subunit b, chloroplastic n=1 Tax=Burmannia cryptopetala TaxID=1861790 RepID=A0A2H4EBY1_9LILI|nr:ATPase subunit I [Burmannia cryptopetala]ANK36240.1 ATPase subunit I [Burmannia cryptopetala]